MKKTKIFFIPFAGGTTAVFDRVKEEIAPAVDGISIDYRGHGSRLREPFYEDWNDMLGDISQKINSSLSDDDELAIFGYSIGSIVVYELIAGGWLAKTPVHIFLASHEAPWVEWGSKKFHELSDEDLLEVLRPKGGFDRVTPKLLENKAFYRMFFGPLKEDYRLIGEYKMSKEALLPAPATVFFGTEDLDEESIHTWDRHLKEGSDYIPFKGNHFFIKEHEKEVADIVLERMQAAAREI